MPDDYRVPKTSSGELIVEEIRGTDDVYLVVITGYTNPDAFNHEKFTNYDFSEPQSIDMVEEFINEYSSEFPPGIEKCRGIIIQDLNDETVDFEEPIEIYS